ncbi:hypothetical protein HMPREF2845_05745 [Rothia sp. HMSC065B04]|nr:hypothetical protein HMPREF2845_05745 [Rothia sp. HMSC065B04]
MKYFFLTPILLAHAVGGGGTVCACFGDGLYLGLPPVRSQPASAQRAEEERATGLYIYIMSPAAPFFLLLWPLPCTYVLDDAGGAGASR